jgi:uncharacterized metal-binding protein
MRGRPPTESVSKSYWYHYKISFGGAEAGDMNHILRDNSIIKYYMNPKKKKKKKEKSISGMV